MKTAIHYLYPSSKFCIVILITLLSMFIPGYFWQYLVFPLVLILTLFSKNTKEFLATFFKAIVILVLFIFIIQVFIVTNEDSITLWKFIKYSDEGLNMSLEMTSKIVAISSIIIYFFQVTSTKDIIYALEKSGSPKKVTFVIASTIQLIPQMSALSKTIMEAQQSRGISVDGSIWKRMTSFIPMIGPLVLSSIQQTEERVLALESRGFSSTSKKTSIYQFSKSKIDYAIQVISISILLIYFIWRVV